MKKSIWCIIFLIPLFISNQPLYAQITGIKNLVNTNSGLCLAVRGATHNNGEEGTIWTCDGGGDKNWIIIDAGSFHSVGIKSDGSLWAWGDNSNGQIGDGTNIDRASPVQIGTDNKWISISCGYENTIGLKSDGTLWAWGENNYGELGDGTTTFRITPVQIGADDKWVSIASGFRHTLGLKSDGSLWTWGLNQYGQLGDGTTIHKYNPMQIGTDFNWVGISAGSHHSLALKSDGSIWAWGWNYYGSLGDGTTIQRNSPVQIGADNKWTSISAGLYHNLGLKSDGTLWAWGENTYGELGDGTTTQRNSPVQIGTDNKWVSITAGSAHSVGLKSDGTILAWGYNFFGQLGDGTSGFGADKNTPIQTSVTLDVWLNASAGNYHSLGLKSDGTLWAWGNNYYGQLGDSSNIDKKVITQIGTATNWVSIYPGSTFCLGKTSDGKLWSTGDNYDGELGDGTTNQSNLFTQVGIANNWLSIAAGGLHTLGLTNDGNLWGWGNNYQGQSGNGTTIQSYSPKQSGIITGLAATGSTATMMQGQYNMYNNGASFIASVSSTRASLTPITGEVTAKVWIEASQPAQYVNRHYEITPVNNAGTATGRITLYFLQAEFDAFNAVNTVTLPTSGNDATGIANLLIEKRSGTSSDSSGLPNTYSGTPLTINPTDADIIWNATLNRWEVSFDVKGFSGFFVKTSSFVLPLKLLSFAGSKVNGANQLVWKTSNEINTREFNIEWSIDALQWKTLGTVTSTGNNNNTYNYMHNNAPTGKNFYKLKMVDQDGHFTYSNIIFLNSGDNTRLVIYPNPVKDMLTIYAGNNFLNTMVSLNNMEGKLLQRTLITSNQQNINVQLLPKGMYVLNFEDGSAQKFIKQ